MSTYATDDHVLHPDQPVVTAGFFPKLMQSYITAEPARRVRAFEVRCFICVGPVIEDDQTGTAGIPTLIRPWFG